MPETTIRLTGSFISIILAVGDRFTNWYAGSEIINRTFILCITANLLVAKDQRPRIVGMRSGAVHLPHLVGELAIVSILSIRGCNALSLERNRIGSAGLDGEADHR